MRRVLIILVILELIAAAALGWSQYISKTKAAPAPDYETIKVDKGTLISTVSATGAIEPEGEVSLIFRGAGRVREVLIKDGETVTADQILARLETEDLDLALAQAETGLRISKEQLERLKIPVDATDIVAAQAAVASAEANITSAQAAVTSAQANYNSLQTGPSEDQKRAASSTLERARVMRDQAQAAYDQVATRPEIGLLPQSVQLQQATIDYETAEANYRVTTAPATEAQLAAANAQIVQSQAAVAQARAALAQAQASLAKLQRGPVASDLAVAEAQVTQAELSVQQAKLTRENTALISPIAGVVTQLNITPGELPNAARPAVVVTDLSQFHINITVDEIDISSLAEGQPVRVTLDAMPDATLDGHIDNISDTPVSGSSGVSYRVRVVIDEANVPLRSGLSATASIVTQELKDVVVIPNRSVQIDRSNGRTYVEKIVDGIPTSTEVQLGARNEQYSQVVSGVNAGDVLAIRSGSSLDRLRSTMFGN